MLPRYTRSVVFIFISFCLLQGLQAQDLPTAKPEDVGLSSERLQRLTSVFQAYTVEKKMAGCVILILRHGKVAYFNAFGKRDIDRSYYSSQFVCHS